MWNMVIKVAEANQIDVMFDLCIENSIKEAIDYVNLLLQSPTPVELEKFWCVEKNLFTGLTGRANNFKKISSAGWYTTNSMMFL